MRVAPGLLAIVQRLPLGPEQLLGRRQIAGQGRDPFLFAAHLVADVFPE